MEIDLENMIISEEQAHRFAVDIYNDVIKYFQELDEYCNQLYHRLDELVSKAVCTLDGEVIIRKKIFSDFDMITVIAFERRENIYFLSGFAKYFFDCM